MALEFDENGRIFVVEDPGYPLDTERALGKVKLLEDSDGDGRPDRSTVFADKLVLPTGVMRWGKGILVTDAPNVWYLEDTNGDGKADIRRIVLTGFAFTNPQHTVNNPVYGLDNWIYLAHEGATTAVIFADKFGDPGSDIRFPDRPDVPPVKVDRRNVRFRPDTYQVEALSGSSQFGATFDEWGRHFVHNNSNHVRHEVIAARYLNRNPDLLVSSAIEDMSDHGAAAEVYPITRRPQHQMLTNIGEFTSACGLTLYLGEAFPPGFRNVSFVAEPAHNLVHRDVWFPSGATFVARRAHEGVEFLASTDSWFRPVNFAVGPDGALYLVDYYREIIEHPEWMSEHVHGSGDLYKGSDKGRIYRIVPDSQPPLAPPKNIRLGEASDEELVRNLGNPNIWWRRTAQRLLVDRQSARSVGPLVQLVQTNTSPLARLHGLWTLEGLGKLDTSLVEKALGDSEPGVRENAILLAEPRLKSSPRLVEKLLQMAGDPHPRVRFQLLCTLGYVDSAPARAARTRLLRQDMEDPWMQVAALSSSPGRALQHFQAAVSRKGGLTGNRTEGRAAFFQRVGAMMGLRQDRAEIQRVLRTLAGTSQSGSEWWRAASLEGLALGLRRKGPSAKQQEFTAWKAGQKLLLKLFDSPAASVRRAALRVLELVGLPADPDLASLLRRAAAAAEGRLADPDQRADALGLLALAGPAAHQALFQGLLHPQEPEQVQAAAIRALGKIKGDLVGTFLLERWGTMTPRVRTEAADALFLEPGRARLMVAAIRVGLVQPWTLSFRHKRQLIMNKDPGIRDIARPLLEEKAGAREKVLQRYAAALERDGDAWRGRQVFERVCAKCHRFRGAGAEVGPDLGTVRNRTSDLLLSDILAPSKSIAQNYEAYVVETMSGATLEGVLGPQTPTTITLRHEEGREEVIRRQDIKRLYATKLSAMPEDLDKQIDVQQVADLLKFLKTAR